MLLNHYHNSTYRSTSQTASFFTSSMGRHAVRLVSLKGLVDKLDSCHVPRYGCLESHFTQKHVISCSMFILAGLYGVIGPLRDSVRRLSEIIFTMFLGLRASCPSLPRPALYTLVFSGGCDCLSISEQFQNMYNKDIP